MRLSDIVSLGIEYIYLGIIVSICIFIYAFIIFRRKRKEGQKFPMKRVMLWCMFLGYLFMVMGVTMLSRGNFYGNARIYPLFYSYKDAWNDFSMIEWRNIILNILMFVPMGILAPLLFRKLDCFWKVSLLGFGTTFTIEIFQLVLKRGIFEPDDLLGNTVGTMIGYGLYVLVKWVSVRRIAKPLEIEESRCKWSGRKVFLLQIPLLMAITIFVGIFLAYNIQEFGNLRSSYIVKQKNLQVSIADVELATEEKELSVYTVSMLEEKGTRQLAEQIFQRQMLEVDETRIDAYENSVLYYSRGNRAISLWMDYAGGTFDYTDFDISYAEDVVLCEEATSEEVRNALLEIGLYVPEGCTFQNKGQGEYLFEANMLFEEGVLYDGSLSCKYYGNGKIGRASYQIVTLEEYGRYPAMSEKAAYEKLVDGQFLYYRNTDEILKIEVEDIRLDYEIDTKGYYQPVYAMDVHVEGYNHTIVMEALKYT